jgi:hypothetical protein
MKSKSTFHEERKNLEDVAEVFYTDPEDGRSRDGSVSADRYRLPLSDRAKNVNGLHGGAEDLDAPIEQSSRIDLGVIASVVRGPTKSHDLSAWLEAELGLDVEQAWDAVSSDKEARARTAAAIAELGAEYFAVYLPWHQYADSEQTPWGMYLNVERVLMLAVEMSARAQQQGHAISREHSLRLAFYVMYRHELFHFHVERFATRHEVLARIATYRPYDFEVFRPLAWTSSWLEEALANAVVLESKLVKGRVGLDTAAFQKLVGSFFDDMPPGYRDYRCTELGGTEEAHHLLAAQIIDASQSPTFSVTSIALPKNEYDVDPQKVPGFLTYRESFVSQFQFATPEMRKVKTWLQRNGFVHSGPGPGDHEVWTHQASGKRVQINRVRKECDVASMKAIASAVGVNLRALANAIRAG